jgi:RND family efflux transporter MFP subunit
MFKRSVGIFLSLLAASFALSGCNKPEKEPEPLVAVQVAEVKPVDLTETVTVDAVLWPINQAAITSKINAPVAQFHVQRGQRVKKGELLATLENRDLSAAVTENKGGYEQAQATYATSTKAGIPEEMQKAEFDVQQSKENLDAQTKVVESRRQLFQQGAMPRKELDAAQVSYVQAKAAYEQAAKHLQSLQNVSQAQEVKTAEGQLAQAKGKYEGAAAQLAYSEIRSPIDGVVTDRPAFSGEMAAAGTALITVMDTSAIIAKAHVSQDVAADLKVGNPATISVNGAEPVPAKISQISPALDPNSTTVEIWATTGKAGMGKNQQLRPGSAAKLSIETTHAKGALAVPATAVVKTDEGKTTIAVAMPDNTAQVREVQAGITDDKQSLIEIKSGLKVGEKVITNAAYALPDKTKIKIQAAGEDKPSADKPAKEEKD